MFDLIKKYEDFERPNLDSRHAIWEVHSAKTAFLFVGLLIAYFFPQAIVQVGWRYLVLGAVLFAAYPGTMAVLRMNKHK